MTEFERKFDYINSIVEQNAAKILSLDLQNISIRHELEQKRRGFGLLAEFAVSSQSGVDYDNLFISIARRINAVLNMQRTVMMLPEDDRFKVDILQGYTSDEESLVPRSLVLDADLLNDPVLVTGADMDDRLRPIREALRIPFLIVCPVMAGDDVFAVLATGRTVEQPPFLPRLGRGDLETVQAVGAYLSMLSEVSKREKELRIAREAAEENSRVKSEFLANLSHEIRTPMNAILGIEHILSDANLDDAMRGYMEKAVHSTKLLLRVIDDIMDFSKISAMRIKVEKLEFSVRDTLKNVFSLIEKEALDKSLELKFDVTSDVPDRVIGDSLRLEQVLLRLLDNGVKFTASGEVRLRVSLDADSQSHLLFEVRDTGIGMTEDEIKNLFQPFTQANSSFTRKYGGMGMGLALSSELVKLMGGEISCSSQPGNGSVFSFTVDFALPSPLAAEFAEEAEEEDWDALSGMRVLLAEDNEINQIIASDLLSEQGVEVSVAANGIEALSALARADASGLLYDLVLMDIQMPEMDGLTATLHIRAEERYKNLPIIALTAHSGDEARKRSLDAGMNDHITKPIDSRILYAALKKCKRLDNEESR
ncbi:hypothetical protein AGMMS50276_07250 [Synergistales bacterium]|nr:hypothetical protein AGMMS50276_07250 [Synergistales bacterium]